MHSSTHANSTRHAKRWRIGAAVTYVGGSETVEDNVMETSKPMVIVTGSSGYIGSAVVRAFAEHFDLVGLDRETSPHPPIDAECVCVDLTSDESVATARSEEQTSDLQTLMRISYTVF